MRGEVTVLVESCLEWCSGVLDTSLELPLIERRRLSRRRSLVFPSLGDKDDEALILMLRCLLADEILSSLVLSVMTGIISAR